MGIKPRPHIESGKSRSAGAARRRQARGGLALAGCLLLGCQDSDGPLLSTKDPSLQPPLVTIHTLAANGSGGDSLPSRLIDAHNLMAALIWAQVNDTVYHQAVRVDREWPMRLDAPMVSTPPPEALLNVTGNGRGRFGMSLLFLFEDANGNRRYDPPKQAGENPPLSGGDELIGAALGTRIVYISDAEALAWVRAHPPDDAILTVSDPSRLRVGFNLLAGVNIRDTVFHQYRILYPGGGFELSSTPPDSGEYETLDYPRKICDGFAPEEWSREVRLSFGSSLDVFAGLVMVAPTRTEHP
jgi:hypothetical protein